MQVLCGLQGIFLLFNCQTPGINVKKCVLFFVQRLTFQVNKGKLKL